MRRAFTLVELLVVVGIMSLLITILIPSVAMAMELSRRSTCVANLKGISVAAGLYAASNHDYLPPFYAGLHYRWPSQSCIAWNKKPIGPGPWNLAYLSESKLSPCEMFYCPSQRHPDHVFRTYPEPWGSAAPEGRFYVQTSYSWNPYVSDVEGQNLYPRQSLFPQAKIMAMDLPFSWSSAHVRNGQWTWNVLFGSGAVRTVASPPACTVISAEPALAADWESFRRLTDLIEQE